MAKRPLIDLGSSLDDARRGPAGPPGPQGQAGRDGRDGADARDGGPALAAHMAATDPHPQYATDVDLAGLLTALITNGDNSHAPTADAVFDALALKAPLVSPVFTGDPRAPTPATSDNDTTIATTAFVQAVIAALINAAPGTLDTLNEIAAALGNDPNFAATMTSALAGKTPTTRAINTTAPLTGGGNLSADRTLGISAATSGAAGSMSAADKAKLDTHVEGTWTPVVTAVANVSANTPRLGMYLRVGNIVYFAVRVEITPTAAAGASTSFDLTLPVAPAAFTVSYDAIGTATVAEATYVPGLIIANVGASTVRCAFQANSVASRGVLIHGSCKLS